MSLSTSIWSKFSSILKERILFSWSCSPQNESYVLDFFIRNSFKILSCLQLSYQRKTFPARPRKGSFIQHVFLFKTHTEIYWQLSWSRVGRVEIFTWKSVVFIGFLTTFFVVFFQLSIKHASFSEILDKECWYLFKRFHCNSNERKVSTIH